MQCLLHFGRGRMSWISQIRTTVRYHCALAAKSDSVCELANSRPISSDTALLQLLEEKERKQLLLSLFALSLGLRRKDRALPQGIVAQALLWRSFPMGEGLPSFDSPLPKRPVF